MENKFREIYFPVIISRQYISISANICNILLNGMQYICSKLKTLEFLATNLSSTTQLRFACVVKWKAVGTGTSKVSFPHNEGSQTPLPCLERESVSTLFLLKNNGKHRRNLSNTLHVNREHNKRKPLEPLSPLNTLILQQE